MKLAKLGDGAEIFYTLQGEGISIGVPAIFVRLSLCNLHCIWCDTDHTWNFTGTPWKHEKDALPGYVKHRKEEVILEISVEEIASIVRSYPCRRVVLTGGEPLLQEAELISFMKKLREDGEEWFFEIETNGTILPSASFLEMISQMNISPKLSSTGMAETLRIHSKVLQALALSPKAWFKFVVQNEEQIEEVLLLESLGNLDRNRIILMPEGRTIDRLNSSMHWLAERCRDLGFRFSDRLHVRLWGDQRGF